MKFPDGDGDGNPSHHHVHHHIHIHHHYHHHHGPEGEESRNEGYGYPPPPSDHYPPHGTPGFAAIPPPAYQPPATQADATGADFSNRPTVRVFCKANPDFSLTIRDNKVILAHSDPNDPYQHWYKDQKFSTQIKDEAGFPSFALINKATGLALKHSVGHGEPVEFAPYSSEKPDMSILWTESQDLGEGYTAIRMVNKIQLNMDAFQANEASGGVRDGTKIVVWDWNDGQNQLWKITPF